MESIIHRLSHFSCPSSGALEQDLAQLRDAIEWIPTEQYESWLEKMLPALVSLSKDKGAGLDYASRFHLLHIFSHLSPHEAMRAHLSDVMAFFLRVLKEESEEMGLVVLRIFIDWHKFFKSSMEVHVHPFLELVQGIYANVEPIAQETLLGASAAPSPQTTRAANSFKVLNECPIIIVLFLQLHRKWMSENMSKFIPILIVALTRPVVDYANIRAEKHGAYFDYFSALVKTLSLLAYLLRSLPGMIKPHQEQLPTIVLDLLRRVPSEAAAIRKDLLVATRHILSTDFKAAFGPYIGELLNERLLLGPGITSGQILKPLVYSMLADLIHHIRMDLDSKTVQRVLQMYSACLHNPQLPISIQLMSAKLLLNLIDSPGIEALSPEEKRASLWTILSVFSLKFKWLKQPIGLLLERQQRAGDAADLGAFYVLDAKPIQTNLSVTDASHDPIKDYRMLLKHLISGTKVILLALRPPSHAHLNSSSVHSVKDLSLEEGATFIDLFRDVVVCFDIYSPAMESKAGAAALPSLAARGGASGGLRYPAIPPISAEDKDVLDQFSYIFTILETSVFHDVLSSQLPYLIQRMTDNPILLAIPQYFLAIHDVSKSFSSILLRYLMANLKTLGSSAPMQAQVTLRLFKLIFLSVSVFPDENETVLQPHLGDLIMGCLKMSSKAAEPIHYFYLLRSLFRSIGGGRFELLYKEVLPLLPVLLESLNALLHSTAAPATRELFVELSLTIPVRLSVLLPYLSYLMQPLVYSLSSSSELISQGLRTLELCIDNLTQDFLDPILSLVMNDLLCALWQHCRPLPYPTTHSHATLRILGKLAGRNRRFMKAPPQLSYKKDEEHETCNVELRTRLRPVSLPISFTLSADTHERVTLDIPLEGAIDSALAVWSDTRSPEVLREQSFEFAKSLLIMMYGVGNGTDDLAAIELHLSSKTLPKAAQGASPVSKTASEKLVRLCFLAANAAGHDDDAASTALDSMAKEANLLLARVFSLLAAVSVLDIVSEELETATAASAKTELARASAFRLTGKPDQSGPLESLLDAMASESAELRAVAESMLLHLIRSVVMYLGRSLDPSPSALERAREHLSKMPLFLFLASRFCSLCYRYEAHRKHGGCCGIQMLIDTYAMPGAQSAELFSVKWLWSHELKFSRSLLYILKDSLSPTLNTGNTALATASLYRMLSLCNSGTSASLLARSVSGGSVAFSEEDAEGPEDECHVYFNQIINLLISELSNSNATVRETIQASLALLASRRGEAVTDLLLPYRDRLVAPIFTKPLRALPFAIQIGHIDAVTYCLTLRPPLLAFTDELVRLLHEAIALSDAEDQALTSKPNQPKNASSLTTLRVVCIQLLSAAMSCPEFLLPKQLVTRNRIVSMFFKSLYARNPEIVEVSKRGLGQVIAIQHKLPKDLLQHGLRPILMNLSDYKRLTVPGLEGLGRLLQLLTSYFKVEIGRKLLDHLKMWANPQVLSAAASLNGPLDEMGEVNIMVAILDVFHLLPGAANIFLSETLDLLLALETGTRRTASSPFRKAVLKYLLKYKRETVTFFLMFKLTHAKGAASDHRVLDLLTDLAAMDDSRALEVEIFRQLPKFAMLYILLQAPEGDRQNEFEMIGASEPEPGSGNSKRDPIEQPEVLKDDEAGSEKKEESDACLETGSELGSGPKEPLPGSKSPSDTKEPLPKPAAPLPQSLTVEARGELARGLLHVFQRLCVDRRQEFIFDMSTQADCQALLSSHRDFLAVLLQMWELPELAHVFQCREFDRLLRTDALNVATHAFMFYDRNASLVRLPGAKESDLLFAMLRVFERRECLLDVYACSKYVSDRVAGLDEASRRTMAMEFLAWHQGQPAATCEAGFQCLLIPALGGHEGSVLVTEELVASVADQVWRSERSPPDGLLLEYVQLSVLLVSQAEQRLPVFEPHAGAMVEFARLALERAEDPVLKQAVHVLWAYIVSLELDVASEPAQLAAPDAPPSKRRTVVADPPAAQQAVVSRVFQALLSSTQQETRHIVRRALEILVPALPSRLGSTDPADALLPAWMRIFQQVLNEDSHSMHQLLNVWSLVLKYPVLFYPHRRTLLPHLAGSLNKMALSMSALAEHRTMAIEIVALIWEWESQANSELAAAEQHLHPSAPKRQKLASAPPQMPPFRTPAFLLEGFLSFMVKLMTLLAAAVPSPDAIHAGSHTSAMDGHAWPNIALKASAPLERAAQVFRQWTLSSTRYLGSLSWYDALRQKSPHLNSFYLQFPWAIFEKLFLSVTTATAAPGSAAGAAATTTTDSTTASATAALYLGDPIHVNEDQLPMACVAIELVLSFLLPSFKTMDPAAIASLLSQQLPSLFGRIFPSGHPIVLGYLGPLVRQLYALDDAALLPPSLSWSYVDESLKRHNYVPSVVLCCLPHWMPQCSTLEGGLIKLLGTLLKEYKDWVAKGVAIMPPARSSAAEAHAAAPQASAPPFGSAAATMMAASHPTPPPAGVAPALHAPAASAATFASPHAHSPTQLIAVLIILFDELARHGSLGKHMELKLAFLGLVSEAIDPRYSPALATTFLRLARHWILDSQKGGEIGLVIKEKVTLMLRLTASLKSPLAATLGPEDRLALVMAGRSDTTAPAAEGSLYDQALELVADIYATPAYSRTEMAVKLEGEFLLAWKALHCTPARRASIANRFLKLMHQALPTDLATRLSYLFGVQVWRSLASHYWLQQAIECILVACCEDFAESSSDWICRLGTATPTAPLSGVLLGQLVLLVRQDAYLAQSVFASLFRQIWSSLAAVESGQSSLFADLHHCLRQSYHLEQAHERPNIVKTLLECIYTIQYHDALPTALLSLPLIKYLGKHFDGWYAAMLILEGVAQGVPNEPKCMRPMTRTDIWFDWFDAGSSEQPSDTEPASRDTLPPVSGMPQDPLAELYAGLGEMDMYHGHWRRQALFTETLIALSLEQQGLYESAQTMLEMVQAKARAGLLPYPMHGQAGAAETFKASPAAEFGLWEERWISVAGRLQQWDTLVELAKADNHIDLSLEGSWRLLDWTSPKDQTAIRSALDLVSGSPTPRRKGFEALLALNSLSFSQLPVRASASAISAMATAGLADFHRTLEEGLQASLGAWHALPRIITTAHVPLLHSFQLWVELQEAQPIYTALSEKPLFGGAPSTRGPPLVQELKGILTTWRERLPNLWDDLNVWSELVAWRQHVFSAMNLIFQSAAANPNNPSGLDSATPSAAAAGPGAGADPNAVGPGAGPTPTASFAYRGYHETAWMINRFAHVTRKHGLGDICIQLLNKIYTLPNIEIQDAFLKLREQAKCYLTPLPAWWQTTAAALSCATGSSSHPTSASSSAATTPLVSLSPATPAGGVALPSLLGSTLTAAAVHELTAGLEIINATNLGYFGSSQKAEFFTLKAQFLTRLGLLEEANKVYAQAVQLDLGHAKGWAAWGHYNDARFRAALYERFQSANGCSTAALLPGNPLLAAPTPASAAAANAGSSETSASPASSAATMPHEGGLGWAVHAIHCYLQAATLHRNSRARKLLARVLWLLTFEDAQGTLSKSFELYHNDLPTWSWVLFIPQLLTSLGRKEAKQARYLLVKIAKAFPQALYLPLRTANEDYRQTIGPLARATDDEEQKKQEQEQEQHDKRASQKPVKGESEKEREKTPSPEPSETAAAAKRPDPQGPLAAAEPAIAGSGEEAQPSSVASMPKRTPWEHTEDLMAILKTGYPLLALTLENMVEHVIQRLRPTPDEDFYRIIVTLLYESYQQSMIRLAAPSQPQPGSLVATASEQGQAAGAPLPPTPTTASIMDLSLLKVSEMLSNPSHSNHKYKASFDADFITTQPTLSEIVPRLQLWRDRHAAIINIIPRRLHLENFSRYLVEFEYQKYDEIEIPGQYSQLRDSNSDFVRIDRFESTFQVIRKHGTSYRRLGLRGHDGSRHLFIIQNPAARHARREERVVQIFRNMNRALNKRKETRARGLFFNMPTIVPLSSHVRLIQDDESLVSLEEVMEDHCSRQSTDTSPTGSDQIILAFRDALQAALDKNDIPMKKGNTDILNLRLELFDGISNQYIPSHILAKYMMRHMSTSQDYWLLRKQFTGQYAMQTFVSYVMAIGHRFPHKVLFSLSQGSVLSMDLLPTLNPLGQFALSEAVPFRLTPNLQTFMTQIGLEGLFAPSILAAAKALTEPAFEMEDLLSLFIRDELIAWNATAAQASSLDEDDLHAKILVNVDLMYKRAVVLSCLKERERNTVEALMQHNSSTSPGAPVALPLVPIHRSILDLMSCAANPQKLCQMDAHWHPWM